MSLSIGGGEEFTAEVRHSCSGSGVERNFSSSGLIRKGSTLENSSVVVQLLTAH